MCGLQCSAPVANYGVLRQKLQNSTCAGSLLLLGRLLEAEKCWRLQKHRLGSGGVMCGWATRRIEGRV